MYNVIVVGADDSPTALEAVRQAIGFAKMSGGTLHFVTAYKPKPVGHRRRSRRVPVLDGVDPRGRRPAAPAGRHGHAAEGVDSEVHAVTGDPADALVAVADREGADLIVVGNKGMKGARRVLGSVPNSVAHRAPCSVLILPTT